MTSQRGAARVRRGGTHAVGHVLSVEELVLAVLALDFAVDVLVIRVGLVRFRVVLGLVEIGRAHV